MRNGLIGSFLAFYSALGSWRPAWPGPWGPRERRARHPFYLKIWPPIYLKTVYIKSCSVVSRNEVFWSYPIVISCPNYFYLWSDQKPPKNSRINPNSCLENSTEQLLIYTGFNIYGRPKFLIKWVANSF